MPWWTMLPGWAKLLLVPVAVVWVACWAVFQFARITYRYPLTITTSAAAGLLAAFHGYLAVTVAVAGVTVVAVAWWRLHPDSFHQFAAPQPVTEYRRFAVYACQWRTVMRLSELTKDKRGREYRPKLGRLRSHGWRDVVRVTMAKGQAPEQWELHASGLAHSFRARHCRVRVRKPGRLELDLIHRDPLAPSIPAPTLGLDASGVDLRRLVIGRTETGKPWTVSLLGNHLLGVGSTGAGKASVSWSIVRALAPAIKADRVRVFGIDPKGGMELSACAEAFHTLACDNGDKAVNLLEYLAGEVKARAERYRGRRTWTPESGDPFLVLLVDELADVIAYQTDRNLRDRAVKAIQAITSQGRAPGVCVLGFLQDPRKEIVPFRHLFPTKIALRLDEPAQVDMVLGDGVRQRGAAAHEIPESTPGVAWVKHDGHREPVRARAFHITDEDLADLVAFLTAHTTDIPVLVTEGARA